VVVENDRVSSGELSERRQRHVVEARAAVHQQQRVAMPENFDVEGCVANLHCCHRLMPPLESGLTPSRPSRIQDEEGSLLRCGVLALKRGPDSRQLFPPALSLDLAELARRDLDRSSANRDPSSAGGPEVQHPRVATLAGGTCIADDVPLSIADEDERHGSLFAGSAPDDRQEERRHGEAAQGRDPTTRYARNEPIDRTDEMFDGPQTGRVGAEPCHQ
jgi:hypothetical protein